MSYIVFYVGFICKISILQNSILKLLLWGIDGCLKCLSLISTCIPSSWLSSDSLRKWASEILQIHDRGTTPVTIWQNRCKKIMHQLMWQPPKPLPIRGGHYTSCFFYYQSQGASLHVSIGNIFYTGYQKHQPNVETCCRSGISQGDGA